eukprot:c14710_g1_i1.p1 GENE.c14710_g1_i1~~c14710_g1_i1.p1  ORF type:complete len:591 (+),score=124.85 c14710_g1_i1:205-1773(+)
MNELKMALFGQVSQKALRHVNKNLFQRLHDQDLSFHLSRDTGALVRIIDRGSRGINFAISAVLFNVVPTAIEIALVSAILSYQFGAPYAAVTLATMATYVAFTFITTAWRTRFRKEMNGFDNRAGSVAIDSLINFETVKLFNRDQHEITRYDEQLKGYEAAAVKTQWSLAFLNFGQGAIFATALTTMMAMASYGVVKGYMTVGDVVLVQTLLFQLSLPLNFLGTIYRELKQSVTDMENMWTLLQQRPKVANVASPEPFHPERGTDIRFENVSFGYLADKNILDSISFEIKSGTKVAFVGTSGSGKSTILRLLYRFYDPTHGRIFISGSDIKHVTLNSLRTVIGVIPQEVCLLNDTIRYNIAYGKQDATDTEVENAAKAANIHEAICAMPLGYNTLVGERGLKLSGGEKQRIGIARTLLKQPLILLADEATSALDSETEQRILAEIQQTFQNITVVVIAHRLSTILDAHRIFVLDDGQIVETGTHNELVEIENGKYRSMWLRQQAFGADGPNSKPTKQMGTTE